MTDDAERSQCFFRQMDAFGPLEQIEELPLESDVVRALMVPETLCKVGGCALSGQDLIDHLYSCGVFAQRDDMDAKVASSCKLNDIVHPRDYAAIEIQETIKRAEEQIANDAFGDTNKQ